MQQRAIREQTGTLRTVLFAAGPALGWVVLLRPDALARGGLAPVAVALVVAAFVGLPLASAEWENGPVDHASGAARRAAEAVADLWSLLIVAALAAPLVAELGGQGIAVAAGAWMVGAVVMQRGGIRVAAIVVGMAMLTIVGASLAAAPAAVPWTLIEPQWAGWRAWMPSAVTGGILLSGAGLGQWATAPHPVPGRRRLHWTATGLALFAVLAVIAQQGAYWEAGLLDPVPGPSALAPLIALAAVGCCVLARTADGSHPVINPLVGLAATLWFAFPGAEALDLWWRCGLPLAPAIAGLALFVDTGGPYRFIGGAGAVGFVGVAVLNWPGLPTEPLSAGAAALIPVAAIWYAGTRVALWPAAKKRAA